MLISAYLLCSELLPQPGDNVPGQQQSPQSQLSRLQTLEKVRMFVWKKWECLFGKSENVCLGKARKFFWKKWECFFAVQHVLTGLGDIRSQRKNNSNIGHPPILTEFSTVPRYDFNNFLLSAINSEKGAKSFLSQLLSPRSYLWRCWNRNDLIEEMIFSFLLFSHTVGFVPVLLFYFYFFSRGKARF